MAFQQASATAVHARDARRAWMNAARALVGAASLAGAFWVATHLQLDRARFVALLVGGFAVFAIMLLALGRDVARRWIEFGRTFGFAPATRRPFLELGTDRPTLHGAAGEHSARLRLVDVGDGRERAEWLQAEVDLLADTSDPRVNERANALGVRVRDGRAFVGIPFVGYDEAVVAEFLAYVAKIADSLERPA